MSNNHRTFLERHTFLFVFLSFSLSLSLSLSLSPLTVCNNKTMHFRFFVELRVVLHICFDITVYDLYRVEDIGSTFLLRVISDSIASILGRFSDQCRFVLY